MVRLEELPLNKTIDKCDRCALKAAKGLGIGNPRGTVLFLAQNPGPVYAWNPTLVPFELQNWVKNSQGKSANILRTAVERAKIPLNEFYITNIQKCAGPVSQVYIQNCAEWIEAELTELRRCRLIVAMGRFAAERIHASRGRLSVYVTKNASRFICTAVTHPAAPLHPGNLTIQEYLKEWDFVGDAYRELMQCSVDEFFALCTGDSQT